LLVGLALLLVALTGCNLPRSTPPPTEDPNLVATLARQTLVALDTQSASSTPTEIVLTVVQPTGDQSKPVVTATQLPSATQAALPTVAPTATRTLPPLSPTSTRVPPTPTANPTPCNWAQFVKDVTVPDGTTFAPGAHFNKTWRLKNIGTCTWTTHYALVFVKGDQMSGAKTYLTGNVGPGATVDVTVSMIAPANTGSYAGNWMMRDGSGNNFGIGSDQDMAFWAKIKVVQTTVAYDFAANYCSATWRNGTTALACPGTVGNTAGSVLKFDKPDLEIGLDDEPALRVEPQNVENGLINGKFPGFDVKAGDHFVATISCWDKMPHCNVMFQLNYQIGDGPVMNLGTWTEIYDNQVNHVNVDLSSLAGKNVIFNLQVSANGAFDQDAASWMAPQIRR
jgi:hypothetical protein